MAGMQGTEMTKGKEASHSQRSRKAPGGSVLWPCEGLNTKPRGHGAQHNIFAAFEA
jgi:hypothetical protein